MMKKSLLSLCILLLSFISSVACAQLKMKFPLQGRYTCQGYDPMTKKKYSSVLTLTPEHKTKGTYIVIESYPYQLWNKDHGIAYTYGKMLIYVSKSMNDGVALSAYSIRRGDLKKGEYIYYDHTNMGIGTEDCEKIRT